MIPRYTPKDFLDLWSLKNQYSLWLRIEMIACKVMEEHGTVPYGTTDYLLGQRLYDRLDVDRIQRIESTTKHDVIAFLTHLEELAGEKARWLHFGMTSSDVVDTASAMMLRDVGKMLLERQTRFVKSLARLALEHIDTRMMGRSHGMHAEPTTFGFVLSGHLEESVRNLHRLQNAVEEISVGKLSGAVGNYSHGSRLIESTTMFLLGLKPENISTQVIPRDRHASFLSTISMVGTGIERLAINIRHLSRTEIGEVREEFSSGQKGSSAMPHKRNPILSENLCGCARLLRGYSVASLENVCLWHERDISHSSSERILFVDSTSLLAYMQDQITKVITNLVVNKEKMLENMNMGRGLYFSEDVLLALTAAGVPRQSAYEAVQQCALSVLDSKKDFISEVLSHPVIQSAMKVNDEIMGCFDLDKRLEGAGVSVRNSTLPWIDPG